MQFAKNVHQKGIYTEFTFAACTRHRGCPYASLPRRLVTKTSSTGRLLKTEMVNTPRLLTTMGLDKTLCQTFYNDNKNNKAQLSLTNPRDACEKFARFT